MQVNNSFNAQAGTLRGMHYQLPPAAEVEVVRCIRGALWDAIMDLRPDSPTYLQWYGTELTADNRLALYVPRGFAHGFITLQPQTEAFYFASAMYTPQAERGLRWNDPRLGVSGRSNHSWCPTRMPRGRISTNNNTASPPLPDSPRGSAHEYRSSIAGPRRRRPPLACWPVRRRLHGARHRQPDRAFGAGHAGVGDLQPERGQGAGSLPPGWPARTRSGWRQRVEAPDRCRHSRRDR
ncbi:dTDP-4-dehydrorhamnose 3,5-epimerase family protein [Xanthomonas arboricola]|uniref:dTDP-4-dehydrorhamnose 3,5-epimerase family protein n=1 Tax=Xanthomonas arboricola TaxID=56448 RepID=UPI0030C68196